MRQPRIHPRRYEKTSSYKVYGNVATTEIKELLTRKDWIIKDIVKKSLLVGGVLGTVGLSSLVGIGAVSAASSNNGRSDLVDKIASTFSLNKDDVQKVFDEERTAHQAERKAKVSARLQKLVDKGTITAEQKTAIEAKLEEMRAKREAEHGTMKDLTPAERKAKRKQNKAEMEAWAKQEGIDLAKLKGIFMGHHGPRMHAEDDGNEQNGPPPQDMQ
jgi:polyhydroxyalkanoate synthesis regulator phasin